MSEQERERFAAIEHERWAHWQQWMHEQCYPGTPFGDMVIPRSLYERWERQIATKYEDLSEDEKRLDREQVERYWPLVEKLLAEAYSRGYRRAVEALRAKDEEEAAEFERSIRENPRYWDGWPYGHFYRKAAEHLESLAAAHNEGEKT
jgi:hypothetical protein